MKKIFANWRFAGVSPLVLAGFASFLSGCGGGGGGGNSKATPTPVSSGNRTYYSSVNSILVGTSKLVKLGRGFVTLDAQNHPVQVGCEFEADAVRDLPAPPRFGPDIYGINLPAEAVYTPFSYIAISYFSGGLPAGTVDVPHLDPVFGMAPPQVPDLPYFAKEKVRMSASETPKDFVQAVDIPDLVAPGDAYAPGIGSAYENPTLPQPQLVQGWDTIGQAYFAYKGHLNAVALALANTYLLKQQAGNAPAVPDIVKQLNQPEVYPKPGYFPHRYEVRYDAARRMHIWVLEDFRPVTKVLP